MRNITIDLQNSDAWKIQLTIRINSPTDNTNFSPYSDANEVVNELFESLHSGYQGNLETSMRESNFFVDLIQLMYYKCHKVSFICAGSYIDFPGYIIPVILPFTCWFFVNNSETVKTEL